mmetsp:Transcript_39750/g.119501  ORF Transcript_39750/g.119501 Transcript_39750/m.119501 type:complete len:101 (-) Transcript_39750:286-588(-)
MLDPLEMLKQGFHTSPTKGNKLISLQSIAALINFTNILSNSTFADPSGMAPKKECLAKYRPLSGRKNSQKQPEACTRYGGNAPPEACEALSSERKSLLWK